MPWFLTNLEARYMSSVSSSLSSSNPPWNWSECVPNLKLGLSNQSQPPSSQLEVEVQVYLYLYVQVCQGDGGLGTGQAAERRQVRVVTFILQLELLLVLVWTFLVTTTPHLPHHCCALYTNLATPDITQQSFGCKGLQVLIYLNFAQRRFQQNFAQRRFQQNFAQRRFQRGWGWAAHRAAPLGGQVRRPITEIILLKIFCTIWVFWGMERCWLLPLLHFFTNYWILPLLSMDLSLLPSLLPHSYVPSNSDLTELPKSRCITLENPPTCHLPGVWTTCPPYRAHESGWRKRAARPPATTPPSPLPVPTFQTPTRRRSPPRWRATSIHQQPTTASKQGMVQAGSHRFLSIFS